MAGDTTDADVAVSTGTWKVRVAAAFSALTGVMLTVSGLQLVVAIRFYEELLNMVPWVFLGLAATHVVVAAILYRARRWAALASTLISVCTMLASAAWLVYSVAHGVFSGPAALVPPLAFLATVLGAISISDAHRATEARKRLASSGIDLGL